MKYVKRKWAGKQTNPEHVSWIEFLSYRTIVLNMEVQLISNILKVEQAQGNYFIPNRCSYQQNKWIYETESGL